ncbi:MAG: 5'/3'-nucleotidase SurE, partial [Hydrococcus sp. RM1_1_31]|nr:5'/3'-nucleotidase SurE [Hydrococcus sp. RM1_1_31]
MEQLQEAQTSGQELLPEGVGLNVNIPSDVTEGVALTKLDETGTIDFSFGELPEELGEGAGVLIDVAEPITPDEVTDPESEGQRFLSGSITVTPVDGSWVASDEVRESLRDRVLSAPENSATQPLNILLTNDDGYDAEGIQVLYNVLTAAGHHVTLVAPKEQQSGTGTALDVDKILRPTEVVNVEDNQWYVDAGVRTTTWAGLDYILEGEKPDLVISGINEGENIGTGGAVSSGTVSAAVTALLRDVPAIAISAGIDSTEGGEAKTSQAYQIGADYLVNLIAQLQATQGEDVTILPEKTGLSINIPVRFPEGVEEI